MSEAGVLAESHREILDKQFWAAVPDSGKRAVLLSDEAWCIPARNVQSYVSELIKHGETADAISILKNYAACATAKRLTPGRKLLSDSPRWRSCMPRPTPCCWATPCGTWVCGSVWNRTRICKAW